MCDLHNVAGTTLRAHNVKGQENLDNLLKLEVYATMVHEFKCLYAHGYLCCRRRCCKHGRSKTGTPPLVSAVV